MKKIQINIDWSVVFWLGTITVFLWLIARAVGLIHTPLILEILPYVGGFAALLGGIREAGKFTHKIETVISDVKDIKLELNGIKLDIKEIRQDIHSLDKRVAVLETRI